MIKRHETFYVSKTKPINFCGNVIGYEATGSSFEPPFEIKPTEGEHDFNKCEGCKDSLENITKQLKAKFEGNANKKGFPFCCTQHANLVNIKEFDKTFFVGVPEMAAKKVIYTNVHIINNLNSENWYKKITDYIKWADESFGQMPTNCGEPLYLSDYYFFITDMLKRNTDIPKEKKNRILDYLTSNQKPNENPKTDFNLLTNTYEKWLKIFPFELNSYFGNLKEHFAKQLPILSGKPEVNMYSGLAKAKLHTKSSLFEALVNLTNNLLTQINGVTLYKMGLITKTNEIKLELAISTRKLKLEQGYNSSSPDEGQRYIKMLKDWFKDEKEFITEITPLINSESDIDYMKGEVTFHFIPQGETSYFEVEKNNSKRRYTPEKVFDLELKNWELAIDNAPTKKDKLQAANNGIFRFRKDYLEYTHPVIEPLKEKVIKHLQHIIEYINNSYEDSPIPQQKEMINWIEIFERIDIEKDLELGGVYITNTFKQKGNYFSGASFNLTMQYLLKFKKEICHFSDKRKIDYITALNIPPPKVGNSESPSFNQVVFEAQSNYFEFINSYKAYLSALSKETIKPQHKQGKEDIEKSLFDYSNTNNYFFSNKIEAFKTIETELVSRQYVDEKGTWQKEKMILVAFIYSIVQLGYLRPKISRKEKRATLLVYRCFFEDRYKTNIKVQFKPSKFKIGTLRTYKPDFSFIPDIDNL